MKKINNITVVILTYLTNEKILSDCLKSLDKKIKVIIVENSKKFKNKSHILRKFSNVEVICTGSNLGYGKGNNYGLSRVKTDYALILNPDIICEKNFFKNIKTVLKKDNEFSIIGCQYSNKTNFLPAGFFNQKKHKLFQKKFSTYKKKEFIKVDWVTGCSMLINLNKFKDKNIFDTNYFLYFEEFDLCKSIIDRGGSVYLSKNLKVYHLGFKGSLGSNSLLKKEANKLRDWHWMWSYFYFYKKNYNYFYAIFKILGKLFKSIFKSIFYSIIFDNINRDKYVFRFLGLFVSIIGFKSSYRGNKFY